MQDFIEKMLRLLEDPNIPEETKEPIRELLRQQFVHEEELLQRLRSHVR
jgi:hypothetical protein